MPGACGKELNKDREPPQLDESKSGTVDEGPVADGEEGRVDQEEPTAGDGQPRADEKDRSGEEDK